MNKNNVIIGFISILTVVLICIGIYIALTPVEVPPPPVEPDPHPANELTNLEILEMAIPNTKVPKRMVIRNYPDGLDMNQINAIPNLSYRILTKDSKNYMLIMPYRNNGVLTVTELKWDTYLEQWMPNDEKVIFREEFGDNYALLLQYDRPEAAKYELKLTQEDGTVTYRISAPAVGEKVAPLEYFAADVVDENVDAIYQPVTTQPISTVTTPEETDGE